LAFRRSGSTSQRREKAVIGDGGALAWHAELEMTQPELDKFLCGRWVARLATNGRDGYPHITPCYYYWDGHAVYVTLARTRVPGRNLSRDSRCAIVIDMDMRPVMGYARNLGCAVTIVGNAQVFPADDGATVGIDAGPWRGEQPVSAIAQQIVARYQLWERDGVFVGSRDELGRVLQVPDRQQRVLHDIADRIVIKIRPHRIVSWDFAKAPLMPDEPYTAEVSNETTK
jgi:hypothetical protein